MIPVVSPIDRRPLLSRLVLLWAVAGFVACEPTEEETPPVVSDAGGGDSGEGVRDAGEEEPDAGEAEPDAGEVASCAGGSWLQETVEERSTLEYGVGFVLDAAGAPHIAYLLDEALRHAERVADSWLVTPLPLAPAADYIGIGVDPAGVAHVAFQGETPQSEKLIRYVADTPRPVVEELGVGFRPQLAVDGQGGVHIVFEGTDGVVHAYKAARGEWSATTIDEGLAPVFALDEEDGAHFLYAKVVDGIFAGHYAYLPFGAAEVTTARILPSFPNPSTGSIAVDDDGRPHVAFVQDDADGQHSVLMYGVAGAEGFVFEPAEVFQGIGFNTAIAVDRAGRVHIALDGIGADIQGARYGCRDTVGAWSVETLDGFGFGLQPVLRADDEGGVHMVAIGYFSDVEATAIVHGRRAP